MSSYTLDWGIYLDVENQHCPGSAPTPTTTFHLEYSGVLGGHYTYGLEILLAFRIIREGLISIDRRERDDKPVIGEFVRT